MNDPGMRSYVTLLCEAFVCRFCKFSDSFCTQCQHLEDSDVVEQFSCYLDDRAVLLTTMYNRSTCSIDAAAFAGLTFCLQPEATCTLLTKCQCIVPD